MASKHDPAADACGESTNDVESESEPAPPAQADSVPNPSAPYESLREEIEELGPFAWRWHTNINQGERYKQYLIARSKRRGPTGPPIRREWRRASELSQRELARAKLFMYDQNQEYLLSSVVVRTCILPWVGDAVHPSWLVDSGKG